MMQPAFLKRYRILVPQMKQNLSMEYAKPMPCLIDCGQCSKIQRWQVPRLEMGLVLMPQVCSDDCGFYMLEFMRKWDGRVLPALEPDDIVESRKVCTYELIATQPFNENKNAKDFIEENTK